ncbi:MAG: 2-oxoglutarate dehydrogenase E1 component [Sphingobacteriales bacterium]|nr:2-oxoglutarate dehydrogenase E1 component [Sphingobacteriales bacterium]
MSAEQFISNAHPAYIESLYRDYQQNPAELEIGWRKFFEGFDFALQYQNATAGENGADNTAAVNTGIYHTADLDIPNEIKVYSLIYSYRKNAHLISKTNPIRQRKDRRAYLELSDYGLTENLLDQEFYVGNILGLGKTTLSRIIAFLQKAYGGSIGVEYHYIRDPQRRHWIREKIEMRPDNFGFSIDKKKRILKKLNEATVLEEFLGKKFLGEKRFSLEGGESTIPALDAIINTAADQGAEECTIAMAHRGRLNVLSNIMGKTYDYIFSEFEGRMPSDQTMGDGDVKYHLGYSSLVETPSGKKIHLKLAPNPSHLEAVDPVLLGFTRAKADVVYQSDFKKIMPIIIHGDAAVAGQGVIYEIAQMANLRGYLTGGTIHFVINNQIGFTTDFDDARSSDYCTAIAAIVEAPVLHVNGDDAEAVVYVSEMAAEYRQRFGGDVYIDMVCYRKHGHNEGDDPKFTQPQMYNFINKHANVRDLYVKKLTEQGDLEATMAKALNEDFWKQLQDRLDDIRQNTLPYKYQEPEQAWRSLNKSTPASFEQTYPTAISDETLQQLVNALDALPENFTPMRKVSKMLEDNKKMLLEAGKADWASAELLAYASILKEGNNVRMSGQDVKRGTFSHRHAVIWDENTNAEYNRLSRISDTQGRFLIYNSLLSEFAVLAFEYGYSMASPDQLVLWEAQFGDFANGAQTIFDQFIASGESKWQRMSGLVMLLPHGYEGQGPEHSSARLERYLQATAEENIIVANITEPANFFHILRRQLAFPFRKPLVVMSPKSLLRHPRCVSPVAAFTTGHFKEVIDDTQTVAAAKVKRILLCSGKLYYELLDYKEQNKRNDIALVRLEQLYPLPAKQLNEIVKKYKNAEVVWVQEEPENMGAWWYLRNTYREAALRAITRKRSASTATGFKKLHQKEQEAIINKAFE